jgi:hypothetical protein
MRYRPGVVRADELLKEEAFILRQDVFLIQPVQHHLTPL